MYPENDALEKLYSFKIWTRFFSRILPCRWSQEDFWAPREPVVSNRWMLDGKGLVCVTTMQLFGERVSLPLTRLISATLCCVLKMDCTQKWPSWLRMSWKPMAQKSNCQSSLGRARISPWICPLFHLTPHHREGQNWEWCLGPSDVGATLGLQSHHGSSCSSNYGRHREWEGHVSDFGEHLQKVSPEGLLRRRAREAGGEKGGGCRSPMAVCASTMAGFGLRIQPIPFRRRNLQGLCQVLTIDLADRHASTRKAALWMACSFASSCTSSCRRLFTCRSSCSVEACGHADHGKVFACLPEVRRWAPTGERSNGSHAIRSCGCSPSDTFGQKTECSKSVPCSKFGWWLSRGSSVLRCCFTFPASRGSNTCWDSCSSSWNSCMSIWINATVSGTNCGWKSWIDDRCSRIQRWRSEARPFW